MRPLLLPQHLSGGVQTHQLPVLVFFVTGHAGYCDLDCFSGCIVYLLACIPTYSCSLLVVVVNCLFFAGNSYYGLVFQWWQCMLSCS